jgi:hypothetical protein
MEGLRSNSDLFTVPAPPARFCAEPGCKTRLNQHNPGTFCLRHENEHAQAKLEAQNKKAFTWERQPSARPPKYGTLAQRIRKAAASPALEAMHEPLELEELPAAIPATEIEVPEGSPRECDPPPLTGSLGPERESTAKGEGGQSPEQAAPPSQPASGAEPPWGLGWTPAQVDFIEPLSPATPTIPHPQEKPSRMDKLVATVIDITQIPDTVKPVPPRLGRLGELWDKLLALKPGKALAVENRDSSHRNRTLLHIRHQVEKKLPGMALRNRADGSTLFVWLEEIKEA